MKKYRHSVEKIRPDKIGHFDQQFWPVLIATIVLCSIAAGAIVTLIAGPWMWVSLLVLPAAAALAIFLLHRLEDNVLRRSLQFAILISLAIHLAIMILTSLTFVFGNPFPDKELVVTKTPQRQIVIKNRAQQFVFQEKEKQQIQDQQKIELEKEVTAATKVESQPIPVVQKQPAVKPALTQRKKEQQSIPRREKNLSKRSRNSQNRPQPTKSAATTAKTQQNAQPAATSAAPAETKVTRRSESKPSDARQQTVQQSSVNESSQSLASRRTTRAEKIEKRDDNAAARIRKSTARLPKVSTKRAAQNTPNKSTQPAESISKSESQKIVVKRSNPKSSSIPKKSNATIASAQSTIRKTISNRRQSSATATQLRTQKAERNSQRQISAKTPSTTNNPNLNSLAASSNQTRLTPQPKSIAVSRSTNGKMGAGRSQNLERTLGGQPSPVNIASNAASKRQTNRLSENIALNSSQRSNRMERGRAKLSKRALKSETARWSNKSGSSVPAEATAQASSATIDSSSVSSQNSIAAEKGTSMLDLGATKVVSEPIADRRGGGGSPELNDSLTRQSQSPGGRQSNQLPVVNTTQNGAWQGQTQAPESPRLAPDGGQESDQIAKNSDTNNSPAPSGKSKGLDNGLSESDNQQPGTVGSIAERRSSDNSQSGTMAELSGESPISGNARTRVASAPKIERQLAFGSSGSGQIDVETVANDGDQFSTSEQVQKATDSMASGGMLGTASKVMAASMAGLPLYGERTGSAQRRNDRDNSIQSQSNHSGTGKARNGRSLSPSLNTNPISLADKGESSALASELSAAEDASGELSRQQSESLNSKSGIAIELDADSGPGGFGERISKRVGRLNDAITESENLSPLDKSRFKRREFGGIPSVQPLANLAKEAFKGRNPANLADAGPQTERAIELGLEFLARCQLADGSWTLSQFDNQSTYFQSQLNSDTAATGLALLAFQGAGFNHREFKYAERVKNGIDWLITNQTDDGGLFVESDKASNKACRLYSHAIATLALAEAYGMTQDPEIRPAAQQALNYIVQSQHTKKGGWRYFVEPINQRQSDTSVTGWMMMALKSGQLAGLEVPQKTFDGIDSWLKVAEVPNSKSEFRYNPYGKDSDNRIRTGGKRASVTMTSVGLLMRAYSGWNPGDEKFLQGAEQLLKQLPSDRDSLRRDTYYWYYATQVMKHAGGKYWDKWSSALHPLLVSTQEKAGPMQGSWHPYRPVPDRWAPQGGRLYVTTMNLLSLEVRYRLLPLYENTIK